MSAAFFRLRRTGHYALLVHAARTTAALGLAWPLLGGFGAAVQTQFFRAHPTAADASLALELILRDADLPWMAAWAGGYALLSPALTLAWLIAMQRDDGAPAPPAPLAALVLYPRALLLLAGVPALGIALCAPGIALALAQPWLPEALQPGAAWLGATLAACGLVCALSIHDAIRAALVPRRALGGAIRLGLSSISARLLGRRAMLLLATLTVALLGELGSRVLTGAGIVLAAQQSAALLQTLLAGLWLATTVEAVRAHEAGKPGTQPT